MSTPGGTTSSSNSAGSARGVHVPGGDQTRPKRRDGKRQERVQPIIPARAYPLPGQAKAKPLMAHKPARKAGR